MARIKYFDTNENVWKYADNVLVVAPVLSVNGKTGTVDLTAEDVGAISRTAYFTKKAQLTLEDGSVVLIDVVVASEGEVLSGYVNQVPLSVDTDGSVYNDVGYQDGYRLSSSGTLKELVGSTVSGYIPAKAGDVVRIYGVRWACTDHGQNYICAYDSAFRYIGGFLPNTEYVYDTPFVENLERTGDYDGIVTLNDLDTVTYIRVSSRGLSAEDSARGADMIITRNQEIT